MSIAKDDRAIGFIRLADVRSRLLIPFSFRRMLAHARFKVGPENAKFREGFLELAIAASVCLPAVGNSFRANHAT
jgi:hypothetical protein